MIKINEDFHQIKEIKIQPEQESCSCCCQGQEQIDFEKTEQKRLDQT